MLVEFHKRKMFPTSLPKLQSKNVKSFSEMNVKLVRKWKEENGTKDFNNPRE